MTAKRFWILMTFGGVLMFIGGLVATIVLTIETGERVPDSQCSSMRASVLNVCYTSDDPKVLLGVGPMLLGGAMVGIGIWRWIAASSYERSTSEPDTFTPPPPPPPAATAESADPLAEIEAIRKQAKTSTKTTPAPPPGSTPPAPPPG